MVTSLVCGRVVKLASSALAAVFTALGTATSFGASTYGTVTQTEHAMPRRARQFRVERLLSGADSDDAKVSRGWGTDIRLLARHLPFVASDECGHL